MSTDRFIRRLYRTTLFYTVITLPYDHALAERMRPAILPRAGTSEKNMFGGIGFFVFGNMCCGIWKDLLVVRLSPTEASEALKEKNVRVMDLTGKPMKGWLFVEPEGIKHDKDLLAWIERSYTFASSLPHKQYVPHARSSPRQRL